MRHQLKISILSIATIIILAGCGILNSDEPEPIVANTTSPVVTISNPRPNDQIPVNTEIKVQSTSTDETGISRIELLIDGEILWRDANPEPEPNTPYIVVQPWQPTTPGTYNVQVRAYNTAEQIGESAAIIVNVIDQAEVAANPEASPTLEPTVPNTPTISPIGDAIETPTPPPTDTPTPEPGTATPTATPTVGVFEPTGFEPEGRFRDLWKDAEADEGRLGYPIGPEITRRLFAKQYFERGVMIWWDNPDADNLIWVLDSPDEDFETGQTWNAYPDIWDEAIDGEISCGEADAGGPVRGFGKVWCVHSELQTRLGQPLEEEKGQGRGSNAAIFQFFQGGLMIYNPIDTEVYVLFDQGDWIRADW